ncbi:MAG: heme biosynthesis HemY N-terminal domain-containing protein [Hyphomicrobiales bacterium]
MIGLVIFLVVVFLVAAGFAWLADQPGSLLVVRLGGFEFAEENLAIIAAIALGVLLAIIFVWIIVTMVWKTPGSIGSFFRNRRREKGWQALAEGVIAVGSGDIGMAKRSAKNSIKYLPEEPVTQLLTAQAAQMEGKTDKAREAFEMMLEKPETKLLGLRGLYVEAEEIGETEAARHFVEEAVSARPGVEWSGKALLNMQATEGDWEGALLTLHQNADSKLYTKKEAKRLRAVLLTGHAAELEEGGDPQKAKAKALEAHRLAPELVPAAVIAARVLARVGDLRKAAKIVETSWKLDTHPELIATYTQLRSGDSGLDRLKRAENLNNMKPNHPEGVMGVVRAKIDVQDWVGARKDLEGLLATEPTRNACLLMSEIEEGEFGDRGHVREWLSRAVRAPRDAAWTADGYVADEWAPFSPVTSELDAFEWRVPVENLDEEQDLQLEQIPSGPMELPVLEAASGVAIMNVANDDDVVDVIEDEASEVVANVANDEVAQTKDAEDLDTSEAEEPSSAEKSDTDEADETDAETEKEAADEPIIESEEVLEEKGEAAAEDEEADASSNDEEQPKKKEDPINKPPIDDPGAKAEAEKPKKRFRLF